ncbi:MAG: DUF6447 family protein [Azospira sp.]|jgi:hypothetical protein|nr:DUF6447 family protein [Azospira sp.]
MPKLKIDNLEYDTDTFPEAAKQNLQMLQLAEQEIQRLQVRLAIAQTARNAYLQSLKQNLPAPLEQLQGGDTLKFN